MSRLWDPFVWEEDTDARRDLVASFIESLLKDRGTAEVKPLKAILTPWEVINAIAPDIWHTKVPLEIRVQVHKAWLEQEQAKSREPFLASHVIKIATPRILAANILLVDLHGVIKLGLKRMGFDKDDGDVLDHPKG